MAEAGGKVFLLCLALLILISPAAAASIRLVAVAENGTGSVANLSVEAMPGSGRTLVETEPFIGITAQSSERTARRLTERILNRSLDGYDLVFSIQSESVSVDGESAGAAMVVATIAAVEGIEPRADAIVTGTVDPEGVVGLVGGVLEKARAASRAGAEIFLIPLGTRTQTETVSRISTPAPGYNVETQETSRVDVISYSRSSLGMEAREVSTMDEVLSVFFPAANYSLPASELEEIPLYEEEYYPEESAIREIARAGVVRAERAASLAPNASVFSERLDEAKRLLSMNYFYSAANEAFLVAKDARVAAGNITALSAEVGERLANVSALASSLGEGGGFRLSQIPSIAAGMQRYSWALYYRTNDGNNTESLASAAEWLAAAEDILSRLPVPAGAFVPAGSVEVKARQMLGDAAELVGTARDAGYDTYLADRSLVLGHFAFSRGLHLAAIYDSVDAEAHAEAESLSGPIQALIGKAQDLWIDGDDAWALNYVKQSEYLVHLASARGSRTDAASAVFLALRAIGVDTAFSVFPGSGLVVPSFSTEEDACGRSALPAVAIVLSAAALATSAFALFAVSRRKGKR